MCPSGQSKFSLSSEPAHPNAKWLQSICPFCDVYCDALREDVVGALGVEAQLREFLGDAMVGYSD
jgi:hypothetical protein